LDELHLIIQSAFGWAGYHLWVFETPAGDFGLPDHELGIRDAAAHRLDKAAPGPRARLRYIYDFGDDWEHDLVVEAVTETQPDAAYPRCLTGRRACPPEDCGDIWGSEGLLEILADPGHDEHVERLAWLGLDDAGQLDPAAFGVAEVNAALSRLMPPPGGSRG
jgi:hypothetical protein